MSLTKNVISEVVANNCCIGCGICAGICPRRRLEIRFNNRGEYNPVEMQGCMPCSEKCTLCYDACPAHGNTKNETEIGHEYFGALPGVKHNDITGYFLSSYVGYSERNGHRLNGASGGMATWTIEEMLRAGMIDVVACVGKAKNDDRIFEFQLCKTIQEVRKCSRSAYYPVEISSIIKSIIKTDANYAIIGLPCVCKAIRLAQAKSPLLKKRIKFVLGIVCGRGVSKFFTEYLVAKGGGDPCQIQDFRYREKRPGKPAKASFGECFFKSGNPNSIKEGTTHFSFEWGGGYFKPTKCFYCDDIFAECADIVFLDAWIRPYADSPKGHNIILTRNEEADLIFSKTNNDIIINPINISQVIQSQNSGIYSKRFAISVHAKDTNKNHSVRPKVRDKLITIIKHPARCKIEKIHAEIAKLSAQHWNNSNKNYKQFECDMQPILKQLNVYHRISQILSFSFPVILARKLKKMLKERANNFTYS